MIGYAAKDVIRIARLTHIWQELLKSDLKVGYNMKYTEMCKVYSPKGNQGAYDSWLLIFFLGGHGGHFL